MKKLTVALACLCLSPGLAQAETPTYTNADLERVAPRRAETGGENPPPPVTAAEPDPRPRQDRARDEKAWRAEARRVAEKVERLKEQAASLRERAAALESDLAERARRARALPGWLR